MAARRAADPLTRVSVFLFQRQADALSELNAQTGIPVSVLIRQGVDRILAEHGVTVAKAKGRERRRR